MNRAGLIVVVAALVLAVAQTWTPLVMAAPAFAPVEQHEQTGSMTIAALIDASIENADILGEAAAGQQPLDAALAGRDVQIVDVEGLLDANQAALLRDVLNGSEVLQMNVILVHGAATLDTALSALLVEHDIVPERVAAIDLGGDDTPKLVTIYVFPR